MLGPHRRTFRAFATTVVPEATTFDESAWAEVERTVEHAIAQRPARLQRQLALLLRAIEALPRVRYGRGFSALGDEERTTVIDKLQHAPVKLVRRGVWGLRTLVFMGCYTRDHVMASIGYRAHPRGWARRGDASRGDARHGDANRDAAHDDANHDDADHGNANHGDARRGLQ